MHFVFERPAGSQSACGEPDFPWKLPTVVNL